MDDPAVGTPLESDANGAAAHVPNQDWRHTRPQLRRELIFRPQRIAGRSIYLIEDPTRTRFFRLGRREYQLAAAWDGRRSVAEVLQQVSDASAEPPITEEEAFSILQWAARNDLLETPCTENRSPVAATVIPQQASPAPPAGSKQRLNPVMFRLPLGSPDRCLARLYPHLAWLYSKWATGLGLMIVVLGGAALLQNWQRLVDSTQQIFTPGGQASLLCCWIVLKIIHETSHGLVCHRYGGTVREAGLVFILFLPIAYVDVTSSWRLRSRWQRIHIAAAGMQFELYVAGLAALLWSVTDAGPLHQFCANLVVMAGITTLLFNANPLMRFDGYYILTDLLEMPNLAVTGQAWLQAWGRRFFLGLPAIDPNWSCGRPTLTKVYAAAAWCWRVFICVGLIAAAAAMWHGAGIVLSAMAAALWIGAPTIRLLKSLYRPTGPMAPNRRRFALVAVAAAMTSAGSLYWLPWPGAVRASAVVAYDPLTIVRTEGDGFVDQIFVQSGQYVVAGQVIAELTNDQLRRDLAVQQAKVDISRQRIRSLRGRRALAALEAEKQQLAALNEQLDELRRQVESLTVHAPSDGRIVSRDLESSLGVYLSQGEALLSIGSEEKKRIEFSIPDDQLATFQQYEQGELYVTLSDGESFSGQLDRIQPRASREPLDRALCAPFGGDLLVRDMPRAADAVDSATTLQYLKPHFTGRVVVNAEQSLRIKAGQRGHVALTGGRDSLATRIWGFLADQWGIAHGG